MYGELPEINTTNGEVVNGYPIQILNPPKTAVVRLPTSEELMTYLSAQRSLYRDLGRRTGELEELPTPEADQRLFQAIRLDKGGEEFDNAEALYAVGIITRWKMNSCDREGQNYVVKLGTIFGETTHTVCIPMHKDLAEYRRFAYRPRDTAPNVEERRFPPEVPVKLYDKIILSSSGYAKGTPVPPHHKRAVCGEVVQAISLLDPSLDPNF